MNARVNSSSTRFGAIAPGVLLAITMVFAGATMAKEDKPYQAAANDGGGGSAQEGNLVAAEYMYICRPGSAIKYRIEPRDGDFFNPGSELIDYRPAPKHGSCAY